MTTQDIAKEFVALLKSGDHEKAAARFNADDIVSHENMEGPMKVCRGKAEVKKKGDWWTANHTLHSATTDGPYMNGDQFAVHFAMDVTNKETGQRMQMQEVGLYKVKGGKIVEERFFY